MTKNQKILAALAGIFLLSRFTAKANNGSGAPPGGGASGNGPADVSYLGTSSPRGIRNNNPGNLRITSIAWQGKIPVSQNTDGAFEQFLKYKFGIRAMLKDLQNDYRQDGRRTITALINAYAPSSENDTARYISDVSAWTGIGANTTLSDNYATWKKLVIAMARKENGKVDAITPAQFDQVWSEFNF
jgi:hypothetical protein